MFNSRILYLILPLCLSIIAAPVSEAEILSGKVIGVSDGDTITLLVKGSMRKVRLSGIDCPEKSQAFGQKAREFTAQHAFSKKVKVLSSGQDRYKRILGEVILPDGKNLNDLLLGNGYAWWYSKFSSDLHKRDLETQARSRGIGLWCDLQAQAPWDFRKAH